MNLQRAFTLIEQLDRDSLMKGAVDPVGFTDMRGSLWDAEQD